MTKYSSKLIDEVARFKSEPVTNVFASLVRLQRHRWCQREPPANRGRQPYPPRLENSLPLDNRARPACPTGRAYPGSGPASRCRLDAGRFPIASDGLSANLAVIRGRGSRTGDREARSVDPSTDQFLLTRFYQSAGAQRAGPTVLKVLAAEAPQTASSTLSGIRMSGGKAASVHSRWRSSGSSALSATCSDL